MAGTYHDDMAPDVEMRLSFPKNSVSSKKSNNRLSLKAAHEKETIVSLPSSEHQTKSTKSIKQYLDNGYCGHNENETHPHHLHNQQQQQPALLPPSSIHLNPKRTLSRNHYRSGTDVLFVHYHCQKNLV